MFGAEKFLNDRFPKGYQISEIIWQQNVAAATNRVSVDYNKEGAKWILVSGIAITADNVGGAVTFQDGFNITLFTFLEFRETTGIYDFWFLMQGSKLFLQASSLTIRFSVGHQYISFKEV